jgi:hypothetical protein
MKSSRFALAAAFLCSVPAARSSQDTPTAPAAAADLSGLHAFDTREGKWESHNRKLKERLTGSHDWIEFDGTQTEWPLMNGYANVDDNHFKVQGADYRGVALRAYDPKTGEWAIWWLDGRDPFGAMDPPVKGRFENGVGTFYADDTLRGKPIKVRFVWSRLSTTFAHWEQAFSGDGGKTWETNWITDFHRPKGS